MTSRNPLLPVAVLVLGAASACTQAPERAAVPVPSPPPTPATTSAPAGAPSTPAAGPSEAVPPSRPPASGPAASRLPVERGSWSPVFDWPVVAVNSHLLPDGKVLTWEEGESAFDRRAGEILGWAKATMWDPSTGRFTAVGNRTTNVFAGGSAHLPDGRLLVTGGQSIRDLPHPRGNPHTNIFDYRRDTWRRVENMRAGRWYPTTIALGNGEMLTVGGNDDRGVSNSDVQVWKRGGGWRYLPRRTMSLYPGMFLAPSGEAFYAGPKRQTMFLNTTTGTWRKGPVNRFIRADNIKTIPSVLYDGTVLTVGGGNVGAAGGFTAEAGAETVDLRARRPEWKRAAPMAYPRRHHNATLLPDGTVLVTGGQREGYNEHPLEEAGVREAEVYTPRTDSWATMSAMRVPRGYHSTALLLPDGRVLVAGTGNGAALDQRNAQLFSPPYLHRGPRPRITRAPGSVAYGERFAVSTPDAAGIAAVRLVRLGATTHSFDMNTRLVTLGFSRGRAGLSVTAPASGNLAPPGHYMLFVLDREGVPSKAAIVRVDARRAG